jgi:hypothetical protein
MLVRGSLALACTIYYSQIRLMRSLTKICDVRSGPVSPHDAGLEQVQEKEPSSSNLDDTILQNQDTNPSTLSSQESLKRKIPDDGFDEDNVRICSSVTLLPQSESF